MVASRWNYSDAVGNVGWWQRGKLWRYTFGNILVGGCVHLERDGLVLAAAREDQ